MRVISKEYEDDLCGINYVINTNKKTELPVLTLGEHLQRNTV